MINSPPSMGVTIDPNTGKQVPQAVMPHRINGQYVVEGFTAASMFCLGAIGFLMANTSATGDLTRRTRLILFGVGVACVVLAYNVLISFLKIKVPNYLRW